MSTLQDSAREAVLRAAHDTLDQELAAALRRERTLRAALEIDHRLFLDWRHDARRRGDGITALKMQDHMDRLRAALDFNGRAETVERGET